MILDKTLPLVLLFLIGYFLKRRKIFHKQDGHIISKLLVYLVVPAVIINAFSSIVFEQKLLLLPVIAVILVSTLLIISFLLTLLLKLHGKTRSAFIICFPTLEAGSIGYAFMLAVFGNFGLSRIVIFDLGNILFLFFIVNSLASFLGKGTKINLKVGISKLVKTPMLWAPFIGILLNISHIHIVLLTNLLTSAGSAVLLLVTMLLGLEFEPTFSSFKLPLLTIVLKTSIGITLGILLSLFFGLTGIERTAVIVASSLPASTISLIFATENDLDVQYVANMLSLALVFGILFATILIPFLK